MNNWTISRRVIAGFATLLLIIIALGVFPLAADRSHSEYSLSGGQRPPQHLAS